MALEMFETFMGMFAADNAPNPHDVPNAIADLIAQAKGCRAARIFVGQPFSADALNAASSHVQHGVVEAFVLGDLATLAV